jgi:thiol:disulfide interchange protein DsbC
MHTIKRIPSILLIFLISLSAAAENNAESIKQKIIDKIGRADIEKVHETPMKDMWSVITGGGQIFYTNSEVDTIFTGDMLSIGAKNKLTNHTQILKTGINKDLVESLKENQFVTFQAKDMEKESIAYIFTDSTCGYCRKLHKEMDELNNLNVTVKYMAFPRSGVEKSEHLRNIWCAADKKIAMNDAKDGKTLGTAADCDAPIEEHYNAAKKLGVSGTPTIVFENGTIRAGYIPAKQLAYMASINKNK